MTEEQKQTIERLRDVGLGYRKIAIVLDLSRDKVRNYCKANGLDGYAKKRLQAKEGKQMEEDCADSVCRHCGKPIEKQAIGRRRIYCSDECRKAWSKNHLPLYKHECMFCGKKFESSSKMQKFCSHDCYIRDRFWRKEDTEEIVKMLLSGKKSLRYPNGLKIYSLAKRNKQKVCQ